MTGVETKMLRPDECCESYAGCIHFIGRSTAVRVAGSGGGKKNVCLS